MKFAKELEDDLVPEWRAKYINYKQGKKRIKAITKALKQANRTPKVRGRRPSLHEAASTASIPYTHYDFNARSRQNGNGKAPNSGESQELRRQHGAMRRMSTTMFITSPPFNAPNMMPSPMSDDGDVSSDSDEERTPLKRSASRPQEETPTNYGTLEGGSSRLPRLELPDPALDPGRTRTQSPSGDGNNELHPYRTMSEGSNRRPPLEVVDSATSKKPTSQPLMKDFFKRRQEQHGDSTPRQGKRTRIRDTFRRHQNGSADADDTQQQAHDELDKRQGEFFDYLDRELHKIEKFYKQKEDAAHDRLNELRAQLHEMRDQRLRTMHNHDHAGRDQLENGDLERIKESAKDTANNALLKKVFNHEPKIGKTSRAMENLASPPTSPSTKTRDDARDYTKKSKNHDDDDNQKVPYRFAKRRLKQALQEYYRGLELLKSYVLLNRTGFRKINKKYDKAVNARPPLRYLNEKISDAHFVRSTSIEEYLVAVEDLYARYFERGNRKIAISKLRSKTQQGHFAGPAFRNGLWVAAGSVAAINGLYYAHLNSQNGTPELQTITSYLLQMYAGYFLALLLFLLFVLDCSIWTKARINYIFVFEYDTRHVLDWRQLAEIPCFFLFLEGICVWLNFSFFGVNNIMYKYWPILLFGITLVMMAFPYKVLYYHARKWWAFSNFRLLFAGFYPVEFRDFFLGDMYCSETYFMAQIEVFFCVYGRNWSEPAQCNSSHSMALGFLTTVPALWRFAQCIRRYYDSRKAFPHLANCGKYFGNILYYMSLSLYRLHVGSDIKTRYQIMFIVFACINGLYCSMWDIFMDWSLGNVWAKHIGLRHHLAYRRAWVYYVAIVVNVVLRHQWIVYAIFTEDLQHNTLMGFLVALAEVIRRGIWTLFRVENEHTNNVKSYRASRDIPLPYSIPASPEALGKGQEVRRRANATSNDTEASPSSQSPDPNADLERQTSRASGASYRGTGSGTTPAIRALQRVGTVIAAAHSQDFQKRKRPEVVGDSPHDEAMLNIQRQGSDSSEDDDEDDADTASDRETLQAEAGKLHRAAGALQETG